MMVLEEARSLSNSNCLCGDEVVESASSAAGAIRLLNLDYALQREADAPFCTLVP